MKPNATHCPNVRVSTQTPTDEATCRFLAGSMFRSAPLHEGQHDPALVRTYAGGCVWSPLVAATPRPAEVTFGKGTVTNILSHNRKRRRSERIG
jgi:hypothetical protein